MITTINEWKLINEIGEASIKPYSYELSLDIKNADEKWYTASFFTDKDEKYKIFFIVYSTSDYLNTMSISFDKDYGNKDDQFANSDKETNNHLQYRILSTVISATKEILEKEQNINDIRFTAKDKESKSGQNQRLNLYLAYAKKHLGPNWQILKGVSTASIIKNVPDSEFTIKPDSYYKNK